MTNDELYNQIIKTQREYLVKLQEDFNKRCDEITTLTNEKLQTIPEADVESRKKIFDQQKVLLDEALTHLKNEVNRSSNDVRQKLEKLYEQREANVIDKLEKDIQAV